MKLRPYAMFLLVAIVSGCGAMQPAPGTVTGTVHGVKHYDSTHIGPPLADREITLIDSDTGNIAARTKTDANGKFNFSVQPGKYSVWGGEHAEYVEVKAGQESTVDITAPEK
ncbi:MAG: carboxypeptidase-like regulatory domain-containing protein [Candidatus Binataceae bacterium]